MVFAVRILWAKHLPFEISLNSVGSQHSRPSEVRESSIRGIMQHHGSQWMCMDAFKKCSTHKIWDTLSSRIGVSPARTRKTTACDIIIMAAHYSLKKKCNGLQDFASIDHLLLSSVHCYYGPQKRQNSSNSNLKHNIRWLQVVLCSLIQCNLVRERKINKERQCKLRSEKARKSIVMSIKARETMHCN